MKFIELPGKVQKEMLREQVRQGNPMNPQIFIDDLYANKEDGGFDWGDHPKDAIFWSNVLALEDFSEIDEIDASIHDDDLPTFNPSDYASDVPTTLLSGDFSFMNIKKVTEDSIEYKVLLEKYRLLLSQLSGLSKTFGILKDNDGYDIQYTLGRKVSYEHCIKELNKLLIEHNHD